MNEYEHRLIDALELQNSLLQRIARDQKAARNILREFVNSMVEAESEIPEKMRRFAHYMQDVHHIKWMYEETGVPPPGHVMRECERCDDRFRHLLEDLHLDEGTFEKVRREMSQRAGNRWDHTRALPRSGE